MVTGMDLETKQWGGLSVGMLPLDEQLMVFMPDMKPWDLIIVRSWPLAPFPCMTNAQTKKKMMVGLLPAFNGFLSL